MSDESIDKITPSQLTDFERQLAATPLAEPQLDRDALMYRAGYAAALQQQTPRRTLPLVFSALGGAGATAVAAMLLVMLVSAQPRGEMPNPLAEAPPATAVEEDAVAASLPPSAPVEPVLAQPVLVAEARPQNGRRNAEVRTLDDLIEAESMRRFGRVASHDRSYPAPDPVPTTRVPTVRALSTEAGLHGPDQEVQSLPWLQFFDTT